MWPWDWVIAAGSGIAGISQKVVDWVNSIIASVMSWVTDAINSVWRSINAIWADIQQVWDEAVKIVETMAKTLWDGITFLERTVISYVEFTFSQVWGFAHDVYNWALSEISGFYAQLLSWANNIYQWVLREIYDPLKRAYDGLLNWATGWFNQIWQYIQHPELLVQLIGAFLLRMWLQYVLRFAAVFTRWIVRNMMGMAGEVFDVLENILSNIL